MLSKRRCHCVGAFCILAAVLGGIPSNAQTAPARRILSAHNWPTWRGPHGIPIARERMPLAWSSDKNVKWKVPLDEPGNSTPIVVAGPTQREGRLFMTSASADGAERRLLCFDADTGKELWRRAVEAPAKELTHETNPYAASSPVTDGEQVYVWHGSGGAAAYDFEGNLKWKKDLGEFKHIWGYAASPIVLDKKLIVSCGPGVRCFLVALDTRDGGEVWRRDLPEAQAKDEKEYKGSWSTPTVHSDPKTGKEQILLSLPGELRAFDPATGEDLWTCKGLGPLAYTSVLVSEGDEPVAVAMSGFHGPALACKLGGSGDITAASRLWHHAEKNPQRVGTGAIVGDYVFILNENGVAWCLELRTGKKTWEERISGASWSSMSFMAGRLYVANMAGETIVLRANPEKCEVLAKNKLDGEMTRASIAFYKDRLYIRSYKHLYCIEDGR